MLRMQPSMPFYRLRRSVYIDLESSFHPQGIIGGGEYRCLSRDEQMMRPLEERIRLGAIIWRILVCHESPVMFLQSQLRNLLHLLWSQTELQSA